jgi:hypothetical protein
MCSISLTLWGDEACQKFNFKYGQVVAFKGARVSEYSGKSLNTDGKSQQIFIDIKHPDADKLKNWFGNYSREEMEGMKCLTQRMQSRENGNKEGGQDQQASNLSLIKEINE